MAKILNRYLVMSGLVAVILTGCQGLHVTTVEAPKVSREETALTVLVYNQSSRQIKITYPISTGMLKQYQHTVFKVPRPGNYKVVATAYSEDPYYRDVYQPVATAEIPIFLNGYDVVYVYAGNGYYGYYLKIVDGMFFPAERKQIDR